MTIKANYNNLHIEFEVDGKEQSTLDWEMPSWSVIGYMNNINEKESYDS